MFKKCSKCKIEKPLSEFGKHSRNKDGLRGWCKPCDKKSSDKWKRQNRDKVNEYARKGYVNHREQCRARSIKWRTAHHDQHIATLRKWRESNPDKIKAYSKQYHIANKQKLNDKMKRWWLKNKHKLKEYNHKRKARRFGVGGSYTQHDIDLQFKNQSGKCWWCSELLGEKYHRDHRIPFNKGGTNHANNIVLACAKCNRSKSDKMPWEWIGRLL